MKKRELLSVIENAFSGKFSNLRNLIDCCPDELWNKKVFGFIFWQHIIHTLSDVTFWSREKRMDEPPFYTFKKMKIYPDLERDPEINLSKQEILSCLNETR